MSKHPPSGETPPLRDDLKDNPGIGQSKGTTISGENPSFASGENTVEGDVANDTTPQGGIDPDQRGRTNR